MLSAAGAKLAFPAQCQWGWPPGPLCYFLSRTVPEPKGDGTTEGTEGGPSSRRGAGESTAGAGGRC